MINKRLIEYQIEAKRRDNITTEDEEKLNALSELVELSNWIELISKDEYINIMRYLAFDDEMSKKYYDDYYAKISSFQDNYVNIYPEDDNSKNIN